MAKIEKEFKILNIKVDEMKNKLKSINASYVGEKNQKIYVYDLPTIYYRYLEIRELLKSNVEIIINTNLQKLKNLLIEYEDLLTGKECEQIKKKFNLNKILDIVDMDINRIVDIINSDFFEDSIKKYKINPNKWIRLRKSNDSIELTSKHILEKRSTDFQNVIEIEVSVSSFEETNNFLQSIGISRRSYQEKIRSSYTFKDAQIEIDQWPLLEPYMEIECNNDETIKEIINKLNLKDYEIVSLNTEQLYKRIGIDVHSISELKF